MTGSPWQTSKVEALLIPSRQKCLNKADLVLVEKRKKKKKKKKKPKVKNTFNLLCHFSTPPVLSLVVPDSRLGTVDPQHGSLCNPALTHEEIENRATDRNEAKEASTVAGTAPSHDRI